MTEIFINPDPDKGSDKASGKRSKRPFVTLTRALKEAHPGDTLFIAQGATFIDPFTLTANGVTVDAYNTGRDSDPLPIFKQPRNSPNPCVTINGSDNILQNIQTLDGVDHVVINAGSGKQAYTGNTLHNVTCTNYAFGIVVHSASTTITGCAIVNGRMKINQGLPSDSGAQAIVLWGTEAFELRDIRIDRCEIVDAWTSTIKGTFDGAAIEFYKGMRDVDVTNCTFRNVATLLEVGGDTALKQTISNVSFRKNLLKDSFGHVMYVNPQEEQFYVDWQGFSFEQNTLLADDEKGVSPFFFAGNHGDLSKRLHMDRNIIVSQSQFYNGGQGTRLDTITRSENQYWRSDGGKTIGVPLINGETFAPPSFVGHGDYRLQMGSADVGAMGLVES